MKGLVFAAIAPHGAIAIPDAKPKDDPTLASATTAGMVELGRRFAAARPDVAIILTPHNVHVEGAMAVVDAGTLAGDLMQWGSSGSLRVPVDRDLALAVRDAIRAAGIPVVAVSYGANDPAASTHPLDWAVLIPAWFMGARSDPQIPVVVVAPARDLPDDVHVRAGAAIARAARESGKRVALIASCDHGHGHDAKAHRGDAHVERLSLAWLDGEVGRRHVAPRERSRERPLRRREGATGRAIAEAPVRDGLDVPRALPHEIAEQGSCRGVGSNDRARHVGHDNGRGHEVQDPAMLRGELRRAAACADGVGDVRVHDEEAVHLAGFVAQSLDDPIHVAVLRSPAA